MHLGVIPDGNRRYAKEKEIPKKEAYSRARETISEVFRDLDELPVEIDEATFYLLSEKNLERDREELDTLYELLREQVKQTAESFNGNGFRFNWASTSPEKLPENLSKKLERLEKKYSEGEKILNLLIVYDGKEDIINAAEEIHENGGEFNRDKIRDKLEITTDIDYVIRTGDNPTRECLSGFPIWNSSYAEYYHIKKHFPAVETGDVKEALEHYKRLRRKKGK